MADKLKEIPGKILEWWKKFTNRQKSIIVILAAAVVFTFVILIYIFTKPDYTRFGVYENTATTAKIVKILEDAGIEHQESSDARTVYVLADQMAEASMAIASEGYMPDDLKYSTYVQTGMSTTSEDRFRQNVDYLQEYMENMFSQVDSVEKVTVMLSMAQNTGRLSETKQESFVHIQLTITDEFTAANAKAMAKAAATCIGNDTTARIDIADQNMNTLYAGGDEYETMGIANSVQELQNQASLWVTNQVKKVLMGTKQYQAIEVSTHLDVDYSNYTRQVTEYYTDNGNANGYPTHQDIFSSESTNGSEAGIPGTDSNGEDLTGYVSPDYSGGSSSSSEQSTDYQLNVSDTITNGPSGSINYANSSVSVAMVSYREYHEEIVERQGLLDGGITWEDFKEANRASIKQEVDPEFFQMVANASGIDVDKVTIVAYEEPRFFDKEGFSLSATDITSIVMIILILALLAFVVIRSMESRKKAVEETEELPVEEMLQSTPPEPEVEDIDLEAKSETRKMVEKFVDENPEAAANLLRNWLNEDWN